MQKIDTVMPFAGGFIAYGINDGGAKETVPLLEVRAGVQWPTGRWPGYYLILGKKAVASPLGHNPLLFLAEGEEHLPQNLYRRFTDDIVRMRANDIVINRLERARRHRPGKLITCLAYYHKKRAQKAHRPEGTLIQCKRPSQVQWPFQYLICLQNSYG